MIEGINNLEKLYHTFIILASEPYIPFRLVKNTH